MLTRAEAVQRPLLPLHQRQPLAWPRLNPPQFARHLVVRRPLLPDGVDTLALHGIRVGGGTAALRFARTGETVATEVLAATGLEVVVD